MKGLEIMYPGTGKAQGRHDATFRFEEAHTFGGRRRSRLVLGQLRG